MTDSTATLVAPSSGPALDHATLDSVSRALGGGLPRWLAPSECAEFDFSGDQGDVEALRRALSRRQIDMVVQPARGRRKQILLADMDSTMIGQECIDELARMAGHGDAVADITRQAMSGEIDFTEALRKRVALLASQPAGIIDDVLRKRITLAPGGETLVATMRANGGYTALVSGGFTGFAAPIAVRLGFDEYHANRLDIAAGRLTGSVSEPILDRTAKLGMMNNIAERLGMGTDRVIAVGDGANDLDMLSHAGTGVAMRAAPRVAAQSRIRIDHGDLTALLYIQGYRRDEFVTVPDHLTLPAL